MFPLLLLASSAFASDVASVWVRVRNPEEKRQLYSLGLGFAEGSDRDWLLMHGDEKGIAMLESSGLQHRIAAREAFHDEGHLDPEQMNDALRSLAITHPDTAKLIHIGWSVQERPIYGLRIGDTRSPSRTVRILGAHHGDETASAEVALDAARNLLDTPSAPVSAWLQDNEVLIVPHVNPDGIAAMDRYNANDVDLNRNYGFMWSESEFRPGDYPFSEPETRNIRALGAWMPAGLGLSLHSGATNIGWVWNYTEERTAHDALLEQIAASYANQCSTEDFWITNGAAWYVTNGDTTDWSYGRYGTLDYTIEVSGHKHPGPTQMDNVLSEHANAVEQAILWPSWVAGQITDRTTGDGVPAIIHMSGIEQPIVTGPDGRFSRPVSEEAVDVRVESPGFSTKETQILPQEAPIEITLDRSSISGIQPTQKTLDASGIFTLDGDADSVLFSRPGHASITANRMGIEWVIETHQLHPGPWDLIIDGEVAPRAIFALENDHRISITEHWIEEETLFLELTELNEGAHAWAVVDDFRLMIPLSVEAVGENVLSLDTSILTEPISDVFLWHSGRQVFVDASDTPDETGDPPNTSEDEPETEEPPEQTMDGPVPIQTGTIKAHAGCNTAGSYPAWFWLVSLVGLIRIRSEKCEISGP